MKIESIIRRANGSTVRLGDNTYRFLPGDDGRHVCEVEDDAHIDRLLSIREGFRAVEDDEPVKPLPKAPAPELLAPPPDPVGATPGTVPAADPKPSAPKAPAKPKAPTKPKAATKAK